MRAFVGRIDNPSDERSRAKDSNTGPSISTSFPSSTSFRTAWLVVVLLWPVALLNYLDRQMLAAMKTSVMADIVDIGTEANWGLMLGQFKWVYAFLSPIGGYLADRISRRLTVCGSLFVWSAVTWWTGHVSSFEELLVARSLMGISEAFYIPAALALIADYHTGRTRSRAVGVHQMAIYCGVILGGFSGYAADAPQIGWRGALGACGIFGMIYAVPLVLLLRDVPRSRDKLMANASPMDAAWELATNRSFVLLVLCFTLPALAGWVVRDWMPAILKQQFGLGQGPAGVAATLSWQAAAIVGVIGGGWLADQWVRQHVRGRTFVSALGIGLMAPAVFGVGMSGSVEVAVMFLVLFGFGWGFFDGNNMPILCQIVRPELRATGYGVMNLVSISCGGFADWGFGLMRDKGVPLGVAFAVFASLAGIAVGLMLMIRPKRELG